MIILFLHGWQSTPGGIKPTYLKDHGYTVLNPSLPDEDFDEAVRIAQGEFDRHHPDVVVGSSRGGAVAMNINIGFDAARPSLPGVETIWHGQDGQARHGHPAFPSRRRGAVCGLRGTGQEQRSSLGIVDRGRHRTPACG